MSNHLAINDCEMEAWLRGLPAPVKNHYFYGMLLTAHSFSKDQRYQDAKRWLLNRLAVGKGVLTGLGFSVKQNAKGHWCLDVEPGVAVDGFGREIVVPDTRNDGCGDKPDDQEIAWVNGNETVRSSKPKDFLDRLATKGNGPFDLVVELAYQAQFTDPMPVKAGSCANDCVPSTVREGFRLRVRLPDNDPLHCLPALPGEEPNRHDSTWGLGGSLAGVFPEEPAEAIRHRLRAQGEPQLDESHKFTDADLWVPLGIIRMHVVWDKGEPTLSFAADRPPLNRYYRRLFSNDALSKMIFGLANRVDEASRVRILTYGDPSGDCQTGDVNWYLPERLTVRVIDGHSGWPRDRASCRVEFTVLTKDGGSIIGEWGERSPFAIEKDGTVSVHWRLGKAPGMHTVAARIVPANTKDPPFHAGSQLHFHATALPTAPTIVGMEFLHWHHVMHNCMRWHHGHAKLRIFFSRRIEASELENPERWLRVWRTVHGKMAPTHPHGGPHRVSIPVGPLPVTAEIDGEAMAVGEDPLACWYVDYHLKSLLGNLCENDVLRVLVGIRPTDNLKLQDAPHHHDQRLRAHFEGSFTTAGYRDYLWKKAAAVDNVARAADAYLGTVDDQQNWETSLPVVARDQIDALWALWQRFHVRESCLPSGEGPHSGDFHKAFELRLPE